MNRSEILDLAKQYISSDRNSQYGEPEDSFATIAAYWTVYKNFSITSIDVAVMMTLLKIARIQANPMKDDSWTDATGYLACGAEIATKNATN